LYYPPALRFGPALGVTDMTRFLTTTLFAAILGLAGAAQAATIDLAARGLRLGGLLQTDTGTMFFDTDDGDGDPALGFFGAGNFDSFDFVEYVLFYGDPAIDGTSVESAADATSVVALVKLDAGGGFVLAELLPPGQGSFDFGTAFDVSDAVLNVYDVNPLAAIPLPAAAPMLLAGLGAMVLVRSRRRR
jgi:hypothetical protein